ncbi:alpha/beta fold hydrolase [Luteococcus sp. Sow4_B9]|uniref:alpha/beta fold hydrolase n=1 Tax=Luteococcus sp. Sow4_B9 TaxID=3438792 RepID=UPI003F9DB41D
MSSRFRIATAATAVAALLASATAMAPAMANANPPLSHTTSVRTPQIGTTATLPQRTAKTLAAEEALKNPKVTWERCAPGLQCGELVVPLDYADLGKGTITLPIARRPADKPNRRIGSLFTNPGGPGGPATMTVSFFADELGNQVRSRFDIIGLAPRGVEGADYAACEGEIPAEGTDEVQPIAYPMNEAETQTLLAEDAKMRAACAKGPEILKHMSTADVARDMDLARRALGDKKLTYYGVSYGSYLGATYAALFPKNVRALVVDGVLDPVAWATGRGKQGTTVPVTERILSGTGAHEAFEALIDECERVGTKLCPEAQTLREDWESLLGRFSQGPIDVGDGWFVREDEVYATVMSILYSHEESALLPVLLHNLNDALAEMEQADRLRAASARSTARLQAGERARSTLIKLQKSAEKARKGMPAEQAKDKQAAQRIKAAGEGKITPVRRGPGFQPLTGPEPTSSQEPTPSQEPAPGDEYVEEPQPTVYDATFHGVLCSDALNPQATAAWTTANGRVRATTHGFGQLWLWSSSVCAGWPAQTARAYRGPFTQKTSAPVLVMSSQYDPATPYSGAKAYRKMLSSSRLVTVKDTWAHSTLGVSRCSDAVRNAYLLTGIAPIRDVTCKPDHPLFTRLD